VLRVVQNPIYAGYVPCNGELHEGEHEAILSRAEWGALQELIADYRGARTRRARNHDYFLRGVLKCGRCGAAMTPAPTVRRDRVYRYYRCVTRDKGGLAACAAPQLAADVVEAAVAGRLRQLAIDPVLRQEVVTQAQQQVALQRKASGAQMDRRAGGAADAAEALELLARMDDAWALLTAENRARLVRLLVERVVASEAAGGVQIYLAEVARTMTSKVAA
jgi:hypothetical protein